MNSFLSDIWNLVTSLSLVDYILYFAVITLIMLVVSLIYVMKEEQLKPQDPQEEKEEKEDIDLKQIIETIDENPEPLADMTLYEEEQEKRAIISYDELINYSKNKINYDKEEMVDDLIPVKKISVNPLEDMPIKVAEKEPKLEITSPPSPTINLFSYEKEEEFLKTLQKLNELLN